MAIGEPLLTLGDDARVKSDGKSPARKERLPNGVVSVDRSQLQVDGKPRSPPEKLPRILNGQRAPQARRAKFSLIT